MPDAARFADEGAGYVRTYFGENKNFEYSESSQAWVSELKVRRRYERRRVSRGALHAVREAINGKDTMTRDTGR